MSIEIFFVVSLLIVSVLFIKRRSVSSFIFHNIGLDISTKAVTFILILTIVIIFLMGILLPDQKEKWNSISEGYEQMRPQNNPQQQESVPKEKPHRWFDINFDIFD